MGQYYKPTILTKTNGIHVWWYSHKIDSGLKLMEHSWRNNVFVFNVMKYIEQNPQKLVWAGDYAEVEKKRKANVYHLCIDSKQFPEKELITDKADLGLKYIINHSKNQFVSLDKLPKDKDGWQVHALPLLTCEGNGSGGGDYFADSSKDMIGIWARDYISSCRFRMDVPEGFKEIFPKFVE